MFQRIVVALGLLLAASAGQADDALRPFTTDGCSLFPNGTRANKDLWLDCCIEHDRAYWLGGTYADRVVADQELRQCVSDLDQGTIARLMRGGVRVGGSPWLPFPFRWGYGWSYGRGYQAVSEDEEREALTLMNAIRTIGPRPTRWAQPLMMHGVPNLHQVSGTLYRSAQPSAEGMPALKALGIKTVVNLRAFHSDRDELGNTGLNGEHIYMKTWHPEREDVVRFLRIVTDPARAPVLVHCQHGADRTGTMVALYRVVVQGWSQEDAAHEMSEGGFGFHEVWANLIPWLNRLDIEAIKKEVALQ